MGGNIAEFRNGISEYELPGVIGETVVGHVQSLVVAIEGIESLNQKFQLESFMPEELPGEPQVGGGIVRSEK